jgi:serine/threonine-protein kinase
MGEVYKARDTGLQRDVAIKVLPASLTSDSDRLARFEREAQVLAALNHPNIAAIYHIERVADSPAIVMELVEGETLADRIARGPIPLDEALPIAKQVTEALEAAHEQGIIHRDLKPANIKVRSDGTVKVLDFGLAKLVEAGGAGRASGAGADAVSLSPTITSPALMTGVGVLLGTAAYMSPEQAKGKPADKRSDIWAFGCVLYEMLTGQRAFPGVDVTDTIAAVVRAEPDWSRLPSDTPPAIHTLLRRCLVKDFSRRLRDIGDARFDLDAEPISMSMPSPTRSSRYRWGVGALTAAAGIAVGAAIVWQFARSTTGTVSPTAFGIDTPQDRPIVTGPIETPLAIAPNGRFVVYTSGSFGSSFSQRTLMMRHLDKLDAEPLFERTGDIQPRSPFVSTDSQWVGFISDDGSIMKVPASGGAPVSICECSASTRGGAAWLADGTIVYSGGAGLKTVSAEGRNGRELTKLDVQHGEREHLAPAALPGEDAVLFTVVAEPANRSVIQVLNLKSGERRSLLNGALAARYVAPGYLAYLDASSLLHAIGFDMARRETRGEPIPLDTLPIEGTAATGGFDVSQTGTLTYLPGRRNEARLLTWVSRDGAEQAINLPRHGYLYPRFSPDGAFVAFDVREALSGDLWLWDLKRDNLSRLTFGRGRNAYPAWTPDGRNLLYVSSQTGSDNIHRQAVDGSGATQALTNHANAVLPYVVSPDGTMAVLRELVDARPDLSLLRINGTPKVEPLIHSTRASEVNADLSPDGRWIVYQSDQSGIPEIYVQPFPDVSGGRWQISNGGGLTPLWARSGREIFFIDANNNLMRVEVQPGASFSAGKPSRFFSAGYSSTDWYQGQGGRSFDLSPDGQRFLVVKEADDPDARRSSSLNVVVNWNETLSASEHASSTR